MIYRKIDKLTSDKPTTLIENWKVDFFFYDKSIDAIDSLLSLDKCGCIPTYVLLQLDWRRKLMDS